MKQETTRNIVIAEALRDLAVENQPDDRAEIADKSLAAQALARAQSDDDGVIDSRHAVAQFAQLVVRQMEFYALPPKSAVQLAEDAGEKSLVRKLAKMAKDARDTAFCRRRNALNPKYNSGGGAGGCGGKENPEVVEKFVALDAAAKLLDGHGPL